MTENFDTPDYPAQITIPTNLPQTVRHDHFTHPKQPELKIELSRGQKGSYGWTISYNGEDLDAVVNKIREADAKLRKLFLEE